MSLDVKVSHILNDQIHHPVLSLLQMQSFLSACSVVAQDCNSCDEGHLACELTQAKTVICTKH